MTQNAQNDMVDTFQNHDSQFTKLVCCYSCAEYDIDKILPLLEKIYTESQGPELEGKAVLVKPNILLDEHPDRVATTHPVFVEAVIRFLQSRKAGKIFVGDSPGFHAPLFKPRKSGVYEVCEKTGVEWVCFGKNTMSVSLPSGKVPVASIVNEVDLFFSLPKLKTHELMGYTGAIKNSFGLIPHLHKAKQHAFHRSSQAMASFLLNLNESITPDFIFMDAVWAMEGPGPGNGERYPLHLVLGSANPLALDIIASSIIGYNPMDIETNSEGLKRKKWLTSVDEIVVKGADFEQLVRTDFKLIPRVSTWKMSLNIVLKRVPFLRNSLERKPVFYKKRCAGCKACINICPVQAIHISPKSPKKVVFARKKCISCFCCHEICQYNAIDIS